MKTHPSLRRMLATVAAAVAVATPLAGCGDDKDESTTTAAGGSDATETTAKSTGAEVAVQDAWARTGTKGGNSAIYMEIVGGREAEELLKAAVPADVAAKVELHETTMSGSGDMSSTTMAGDMHDGSEGGDMMSMKQVDKIDIPAETAVQLEPGGLHVMLFDLKKDLVTGDTVEVTLSFSKAGDKKVTVEVREG